MNTDTERLEWLLKYAYVKTLGVGADDWDYHRMNTREKLDRAMANQPLKQADGEAA